jgi:hypothetical protein
MRFFHDLEVMVHGIVSSLRQLFWALLLLFLIMYTCAVCIMQGLTMELSSGIIPTTSSVREDAVTYFGSLITSVYTLYMTICGGVDWGDVSGPLITISPLYGAMFMLYIAFAVFCVLNIVTGVFVESSNRMLARDEDLHFLEHLEERERWTSQVREIFEKLEENDEINVTSFVNYVNNMSGDLELNRLGLELDFSNAMDFFELLDGNSGSVGINEFVAGARQMHGNARSLDVARLRQDTFNLKVAVDGIDRSLQKLIRYTDGSANRRMGTQKVTRLSSSLSNDTQGEPEQEEPAPARQIVCRPYQADKEVDVYNLPSTSDDTANRFAD